MIVVEAIIFNIILFLILMNNKSYESNYQIIRSSPSKILLKISVFNFFKVLQNSQESTYAGVLF